MSHVVRVLFAPELLISLTRGTFEVVHNGLPADARIRGCTYDAERGAATLYVEHESFADVEPGAVIPIATAPSVRVVASPRADP
ncbi:MAG TPA: hypothetical protein VK531_00830 [Gemmatimonadales bacterium]|nr:hypothetical protein [Gemmatimonadales bacterium]